MQNTPMQNAAPAFAIFFTSSTFCVYSAITRILSPVTASTMSPSQSWTLIAVRDRIQLIQIELCQHRIVRLFRSNGRRYSNVLCCARGSEGLIVLRSCKVALTIRKSLISRQIFYTKCHWSVRSSQLSQQNALYCSCSRLTNCARMSVRIT